MVRVGSAVAALAQTTIDIVHPTGSYDANGRWVVGTPVTVTGVRAVVTPGGTDLQRAAEGESTTRKIEIIVESNTASPTLSMGSRVGGIPPDVVIWPSGSGNRYELDSLEPWDWQGYQYATARGEQP